MHWQKCCSKRVLIWRTRSAGKRFADQYICINCDHIHRSELWHAPLAWAHSSDCLNCGGPQETTESCVRCGYSADRSHRLHEKLTRLHPENLPLVGAQLAFEQGRYLLALKLATFTLYQNPTRSQAKLIRLRVMEHIGFIGPALDQAWRWVDNGAPPQIWGVIANLEAAQGNVDGALFALERGVQAAPKAHDLWIEYGELLAYKDNRPLAIKAASKALDDPLVRPRALNLIVSVAQNYFDEGMLADALKVLHVAKSYQKKKESLAWLRAQISVTTNQPLESVHWLKIVLRLDPLHQEALKLYQKLSGYEPIKRRPTKKMSAPSKSSKRKWWSRDA